MPVSDLSNAAQDYLKVIWASTEWSPTPITVTQLAERMGVRTATVSDGIRRLVDLGMLRHEPYGSIELTDEGRSNAVAMVRRHRLIETYLVEVLGYGWDEVHDEAEILEHAVSETLVERMDATLGHPTRDPHGDPIPSAEGEPHLPEAVQLHEASSGERYRVCRISDADPLVLRALGELGVRLDEDLELVEHLPGETRVVLGGGPLILADSLAAAVWVSLIAAP
jgi:DtxR family Mn-dependent transcriptional regulator